MTEVEQDRADMRRLQGGDQTALDPLMQRWQIRLRAYLLRHGVSDADACDLAQDTFVRVFRHAERFDPRRIFSTWMFQIAINLRRDLMRRDRRRESQPLTTVPESSTAEDPANRTEIAEQATAVRRAIESLPQNLQEVLILVVYEQLPHSEVATIIGATPKAVESRLYRAREKLRQSLSGYLAR